MINESYPFLILMQLLFSFLEPEPCHIPSDLAFIFSSGGIQETNFIRQQLAVKTIGKAFGFSPKGSQASILTYGGNSALLDDSLSSSEDFFDAVNSLRYESVRGDVRQALRLAEQKVQCRTMCLNYLQTNQQISSFFFF